MNTLACRRQGLNPPCNLGEDESEKDVRVFLSKRLLDLQSGLSAGMGALDEAVVTLTVVRLSWITEHQILPKVRCQCFPVLIIVESHWPKATILCITITLK